MCKAFAGPEENGGAEKESLELAIRVDSPTTLLLVRSVQRHRSSFTANFFLAMSCLFRELVMLFPVLMYPPPGHQKSPR